MFYFLSCACSVLRLRASLGVCGFDVVFLGHVGSVGRCVCGVAFVFPCNSLSSHYSLWV